MCGRSHGWVHFSAAPQARDSGPHSACQQPVPGRPRGLWLTGGRYGLSPAPPQAQNWLEGLPDLEKTVSLLDARGVTEDAAWEQPEGERTLGEACGRRGRLFALIVWQFHGWMTMSKPIKFNTLSTWCLVRVDRTSKSVKNQLSRLCISQWPSHSLGAQGPHVAGEPRMRQCRRSISLIPEGSRGQCRSGAGR